MNAKCTRNFQRISFVKYFWVIIKTHGSSTLVQSGYKTGEKVFSLFQWSNVGRMHLMELACRSGLEKYKAWRREELMTWVFWAAEHRQQSSCWGLGKSDKRQRLDALLHRRYYLWINVTGSMRALLGEGIGENSPDIKGGCTDCLVNVEQ